MHSYFILKLFLGLNATFSLLSGTVFTLAAPALSEWLGWHPKSRIALRVVGGNLMLFAALLLGLILSPEPNTLWVEMVILADLVWVLASCFALVFFNKQLLKRGRWAVAIIALMVFDFSLGQGWGLYRALQPQSELVQAFSAPSFSTPAGEPVE